MGSEDAVTLRLAGESGQDNVNSAGEIVAKTCARAGLEVFTYKTFPAEIKGGHVIYQLRVASGPLHSAGDELDVLVAFNREAIERNAAALRDAGLLVFDPDAVGDPAAVAPALTERGVRMYPAPLQRLAKDAGVRKNVVAVGLVCALLGVDVEIAAGVVAERYAHAPAAAEANRRALDVGARYAREHAQEAPGAGGRPAAAAPKGERLILTGNQALALGALAGGCRAFFGYPITPASDIMEFLAESLPALGGAVVQTEDEMAALAAVIGAWYAGAPAMTATAGPGFSLMVELLGLAAMSETPAVVADVMRAGPSTGMPTKTEQSDLFLAAVGAHGEAPRVVLAAADVADCFWQAARAFWVAEAGQTPVVLLSDMSLSSRVQAVSRFDLDEVAAGRRRVLEAAGAPAPAGKPSPPDDELAFPRYRLTPSGISPRAVPGEPGRRFLATGLEHDEFGHPNYAPANHAAMMDKRRRKLAFLERAIPAATEHPAAGAAAPAGRDLGVITWGSSTGPVREAAARLSGEGLRVDVLQLHLLWPLPASAVRAFASGGALAVAELNQTGQLAALMRAELGVAAERVTKTDGTPFGVDELAQRLRRIARPPAPVAAD